MAYFRRFLPGIFLWSVSVITGRTTQDGRGSCGDAAGLSLAWGFPVLTRRTVFPARASSVTRKGGRGRAKGVLASVILDSIVTGYGKGRISRDARHDMSIDTTLRMTDHVEIAASVNFFDSTATDRACILRVSACVSSSSQSGPVDLVILVR